MDIKIKLNNMKYRYDVYQIFNIYYNLYEIKFVDDNWNVKVDIYDNEMSIDDGLNVKTYCITNIEYKRWIKKNLFSYLKYKTKKELPWGSLIGIRPSKIALSLIEKGKSREEIIKYFHENYLAAENKAKLCINIANMEKSIVNKEKNKISIYIGMPFCPTRCLYCSFASNPIGKCSKLVEPYLKALYYEMKSLSKYIKEKNLKVQSVYFGGGTPTSINNNQFEETLKNIYLNFLKDYNIEEFTVEAGRPDSITFEKLLSMKKYNVNRISINPQTMNDITLKNIGRTHTVEDTKSIFNLARKLGFDDINMDIIVGLPGEGLKEVKNTCKEVLNLKPDNLTVHGMSIKRGSILHEKLLNNIEFKVPDQNELNLMYNETLELSKKMNMNPYYMYRQKNMIGNMENIGYCKGENLGLYNIQMIEEKQTIIAIGADAVSKIIFLDENRIERVPNVKDVREYIKRVEEMVNRKISMLNTLYV